MPKRTELNEKLHTEYSLRPSSLEDIDRALFKFVDGELNIHCTTHDGFKKVPVIFASPERAFSLKDDLTLRENGRTLEFPLISIVRSTLVNSPTNKGRYGVFVPPYYDFYKRSGVVPIARRVKQDKTRDRAAATATRKHNQSTFPLENDEVVYETLYAPMPAYVEVTYEIRMKTEYRQQMNEIMAAMMGKFSTPVAFKVQHEGNVYEAFGDETFSADDNSGGVETDERFFKSSTTITVLGYILGGDKNEEVPIITKRESAVDVTVGRERAIFGDVPEFHVNRDDKYRS